MKPKDYYDKWLREKNEGICICGNDTKFVSISGNIHYRSSCSRECLEKIKREDNLKKYGVNHHLKRKEIQQKRKSTNLKKYGVKTPFESKNVQKKIEKTNLRKYGVKNVFASKEIKDKIRKTNLRKYGVENPNQCIYIREKIERTCFKKYGKKCHLKNNKVRLKIKKTILDRFGVEHQSQNEEVHRKQIKSGKIFHKFRNTDLFYQGTFELDFLNRYFNQFPNIQRGPSIWYNINEDKKIYFSDFYIPTLNLIIEIKNSYLAKIEKEKIKEKEKACKEKGYRWIMVIDKNYEEFERIREKNT